MASSTRSTCRSRDDESSSSRKKATRSKGLTTSGSATTDSPALRRSTRGTPSQKQTSSSPPTMRKSERFEKRTPTITPPVKRKLEVVEKQTQPSPLRRSDRGKKHPSPSSLGSKKSENRSGSSFIRRKKLKRETSMQQLTVEGREINRRGKQDPKPVGVKKRRMDARTFCALFKKQLRRDTATDTNAELERPNKLPQVDSSCYGGSVPEQVEDGEDGGEEFSERIGGKLGVECTEAACDGGFERSDSRLRNLDAEASENHSEVEVSCTSEKHGFSKVPSNRSGGDGFSATKSGLGFTETLDDTKRVQVDHHAVKKLQTAELVDSASLGRISDGDIDEGTHDIMASKRTRHSVLMDCNASTTFASERTCTSNMDAVSPPFTCITDNLVGTCQICSKRRRVDYDSPVQMLCVCNVSFNKSPCNSSFPKDSGDTEANVQGLVQINDGNAKEESPLDVQSNGHQYICVVCKLGGKLLSCSGKGCKRRFHLSCLDPPLDDVPPGDWHCFSCVKKKIESGVYSVTEGVVLVWDAREVEVQDTECMVNGPHKQKQYFVKYKGLAHIHNHWLPEAQLILEAPLLVSKFNQNNQVMKWSEQWRKPHRLLKKRLSRFPKQQDDYHNEPMGDISDCHYEWLVKWCGLDYENSTWELENASFLQSPQTQSLIRKYENRRQRAKGAASFSISDKKKAPLVKLPKPHAGVVPGMDCNQLSSVSKLREYWQKGRNAAVIGDQDRVTKVILFILSLVTNVSQPFIIISKSSAISLWEAEFLRLGPSTDVVVYSGNKDCRRIIRTYEFYEEGGCLMFQVLLSPIEALVEDFEMLDCFRWEAIIVDDCQCTEISKHFGQIKMLSTEVKVLLFNEQLKDSIADHLSLLSLLESLSDLDSSDGPEVGLNDNLAKLKERLSQFIAYDCKSNFSRFLEYWVPVMISNVQLEQYCATLLSNSLSLRSCSKNDLVGALRNILILTRKCCDHPYIVDPLLQSFLTKGLPGVEYLDVGIKASGKLQLLNITLSEIQNQGLRVVILFQSVGGSGRDSIGDILEDFIRQRFGADSYERIDGGVLPSKKQAILNNFNDKGRGKFVFLLENRACHQSIKLSFVDTIVIFDSDWNPANDLRALNKISIYSSSAQIKIFRLYTTCTVEEIVLVLATQDVTLDSNLHGISRSTIHMLLMWGASYLFKKLDEFHGCNTSSTGANIHSEPSLLKDVSEEFFTLLCRDGENTHTNDSHIISVQHDGRAFGKNAPLLGELKIQSSDGDEPVVFWTKLLEGRNPRWRYSSGPTQRNRKKVQHFGHLPKTPELETGEVGKKRKKEVNNSADAASPRPRIKEGELPGDKGGGSTVPAGSVSQLLPSSSACVTDTLHLNYSSTSTFPSNDVSLLPEVHMVESEERIGLRDVQKSLHFLLKPEISKLCEVLKLSEDVKDMAGKFLEFVIDNHKVVREPASIFQAFQISLCWIAASMLKYKIDQKETLSLAKQHLKFGCTDEEADSVFSKLRQLKKMFYCVVESRSKDSVSAAEDIDEELPNARKLLSTTFSQHNVKVEIEERPENQESAEDHFLSQHEIDEIEISKRIKFMQKRGDKQMKKLIRKQKEEIQEFHRIWEEEKVWLEKQHRLESTLVRSIHGNNPVALEKLKKLDDEIAMKMDEHNRQKEMRLKDIDAKQLAERNDKRQDSARLLEKHKSWARAKCSVDLPVTGSEFAGITEQRVQNGPENIVSVSGCLVEECSHNRTPASGVAPSDIPRSAATDAVRCGVAVENPTNRLNQETGAVDSMAFHKTLVAGSETIHTSVDAPENNVCMNPPSSEQQILDEAPSALEVPGRFLNELVGAADFIEIVNPDGESINGDSLCVGLSLVETPLVRPVFTSAQPDMSSLNLVVQDEHTQSLISAGMRGNRNDLHRAEAPLLRHTDAGPTDQTNHEALVIVHTEQLQLSPSTDSPVDQNQANSGLASGVEQPRCEEHAALNAVAPQQFENPAVPSNQAILHHGANVGPPPIHVTDDPLGLNRSNLHIAVRNDHQPSSDGCIHFRNAEALSQLVEGMGGSPSQEVPGTPLGMDPPIDTHGGLGTHLPLHTAHQSASRILTQPLSTDPLRNELERLRKEREQTIKVYEDTKLQLKADCKKEMEEVIAEIRQKYVAKYKDVESAFLLKKNEFDTNHNKVVLNKKLAEAFLRSECQVLRLSAGIHQDMAFSCMQQGLSSQPASGPSPITGSAPFVGSASASQQTTAPPLQVVHHTSALFSSRPTRSPHVVPVTPSTGNTQLVGNTQVVGEMRAPAPHIPPFRPSLSMSGTGIASLQRGLPSQLAPRSLPITCASQPPPPPPPLPSPPALTYHSVHCTRAPQPEITGGLPSLRNSSLSAMGLLVHVNNQPGANPPNLLPPLPEVLVHVNNQPGENPPNIPEVCTSFGSLDLSQFGAPGGGGDSGGFNVVGLEEETGLVCLSDDNSLVME